MDRYLVRIDCDKAEDGLKTTLCSECALNTLAIDKPFEYAKLYLNDNSSIWLPYWLLATSERIRLDTDVDTI